MSWCCARGYHALCERYLRKGQIEACDCDHHGDG